MPTRRTLPRSNNRPLCTVIVPLELPAADDAIHDGTRVRAEASAATERHVIDERGLQRLRDVAFLAGHAVEHARHAEGIPVGLVALLVRRSSRRTADRSRDDDGTASAASCTSCSRRRPSRSHRRSRRGSRGRSSLGKPAATAFARRAGLPPRPLFELVPAGVNGFGLNFASGFTKLEFVKLVDVYFDESPACASGTPLKYAR